MKPCTSPPPRIMEANESCLEDHSPFGKKTLSKPHNCLKEGKTYFPTAATRCARFGPVACRVGQVPQLLAGLVAQLTRLVAQLTWPKLKHPMAVVVKTVLGSHFGW